jgi:hypothetical protein
VNSIQLIPFQEGLDEAPDETPTKKVEQKHLCTSQASDDDEGK